MGPPQPTPQTARPRAGTGWAPGKRPLVCCPIIPLSTRSPPPVLPALSRLCPRTCWPTAGARRSHGDNVPPPSNDPRPLVRIFWDTRLPLLFGLFYLAMQHLVGRAEGRVTLTVTEARPLPRWGSPPPRPPFRWEQPSSLGVPLCTEHPETATCISSWEGPMRNPSHPCA